MVEFGLVVWKALDLGQYSYDVIRKLALQGEELGFGSFWLADHFRAASPRDPYHECFTTLSAIASETKRIRLGPLVTCVSNRPPSILAKMTSTLDVISGGRLEFGLGAGWDVAEYNAYGIPFPTARARVQQVEEAIQIIKKMWTEDESSFEGRYFRVSKAVNEPKPLQKPHPPVWLGARRGKMLGLVARYADGWNMESAFTPDMFKRRLTVLEEQCKDAGRNVNQIRKSIATDIIIGKTRAEVDELVKECSARFNMRAEECVAKRIVGTPEQVVERLREYVELGVDLIICHFVDGHTLRPVELFSEMVLPNFK
jgi:F420-dependent oxidoreductase-like protein